MIRKAYEVSCDYCGQADYGTHSIEFTKYTYREAGGIITRDGKAYCDKKCYAKSKKN